MGMDTQKHLANSAESDITTNSATRSGINRGMSRRGFVGMASLGMLALGTLPFVGNALAQSASSASEGKAAAASSADTAATGSTFEYGPESGVWSFKDQGDYDVEVTVPVSRVVCLQHHSLDMLCQLGQQDKVVGVEAKWQADLGDYMLDVFPGIEDVATPGGLSEWNVEEIAELKPDVVIAASQAPEDAMKQIRELGIPVVMVSLRGEGKQAEAQSPRLADADAAYTEGCEWAIKTLGCLTGARERADAIWDFCLESRATVDKAVGGIDDSKRVRAFVPMQNDKTYGNDKYVGCQLLRAGAVNVAAADIQGNGSYTVEQLANWDPDVILVQDRYMDLYEMFTTDAKYAELRAVKEGGVIVAPYWTKPWGNPDTDSMALGELWLAHTFYPELVSADDVLARAQKFYQDFYGIEFTGTVE